MNIALCGLGKAGKEFVKYVINSNKYNLTCVLCRDESQTAGKTVGEIMGIITPGDINIVKISGVEKPDFDVIVDFSNSETTLKLLDLCEKTKTNIVICPTNFTDEQIESFKERAKKSEFGIVFAPTLTIGINMLIDFVKKLSMLFSGFSYEIVERHPKFKAKPTKTSQIIAESINTDNVPISSVRLDGYVGLHEVTATNGNERLTITHESFSRMAFVQGALLAADYISQNKGYYEMRDIFQQMMIDIHKTL